jgi:GT2 family glycosyltransferase
MTVAGSRRVCAIIPHHRGRRLLARCLQSLVASDGVELDVVIVANACQEALPEVVETSARIHVVASARALGFSTANNVGTAWAREHLGDPDYVFFVNNDTIVEPETLRRLVDALEADSGRAIAGPRLMIWGADGVLNSLGLNVTRTGEAWDEGIGRPVAEFEPLPATRSVLAVTGAAMMIGTDVFDRLGGWEGLYAFYFEDIDLCLRARSHGLDVVVVTGAVMSHAISATAVRGSDLKRQLAWRNRFLLMAIHWPWRLLLAAGSRTAASELRLAFRRAKARAWSDLRLQVRSWLGALKRWPAAWRARRRLGADTSWRRLLRPHRSVPVIELPELPEEARLEDPAKAAG